MSQVDDAVGGGYYKESYSHVSIRNYVWELQYSYRDSNKNQTNHESQYLSDLSAN